MARALQLLIALDKVADSFINALNETMEEAFGQSPPSNMIRVWVRSDQWLNPSSAEMQSSLEVLSNVLLDDLDNRLVTAVDAGLVLDAQDDQSAERFLPLYRHLEHFLSVVTTRRLYVVYPRRAHTLRAFRKNFTKLLQDAAESQFKLREIQLMITPESVAHTEAPIWPQYQIGSYLLTNLVHGFRAGLDSMLTTMESPCCNSSYASCVYDENAWHCFFMLKAQSDLLHRHEITDNSELESQARQSIHSILGLDVNYAVDWPARSLGSVVLQPQISTHRGDHSVRQILDCFLAAEREAAEHVIGAEEPRLDAAQAAHRDALTGMLDEDATTLSSYDRALYLHCQVVRAFDDSSEHMPTLRKLLLAELPSVINGIVRGLNELCPESGIGELQTGAHAGVLAARLEEIRRTLGVANWTDEGLVIKQVFSTVLGSIDAVMDVLDSEPSDPTIASSYVNEVLEGRVLTELSDEDVSHAAAALDERLRVLKKAWEEARGALRSLTRDYGFFKKLAKLAEYLRTKAALEKELADIDSQYRRWGRTANTFLRTISPFLCLCARLKLIARLVREQINRAAEAGQFLIDFNNALNSRLHEIHKEMAEIPDGPVLRGGTLSFLSREDMQELYGEFGPITIEEYLDWLLRGRDQLSKTWGQWAANGLMKYIDRMEDYSEGRYGSLMPLSLPLLMAKHFPRHVVPRVNTVVQLAAERLLPLSEENLRHRRFHMVFGFPAPASSLLRDVESQVAYRNPNVSLEPAHVMYVDNGNPARLDLVLSVCGFHVEEYMFLNAFSKQGEDT